MKSSELSPEAAYIYALKLLNFRDYSRNALKDKVVTKGFSIDASETALSKIESEGFINDRRFAERFAENAITSGRYAGFRLRQEMKKRKFNTDLIEDVLSNLEDSRDEVSDILSIVDKKFRDFDFKRADDKEKRRVLGYLQRKGYSISSILDALRQIKTVGEN